MNKDAEMYRLLSDAVAAVGKARDIYYDTEGITEAIESRGDDAALTIALSQSLRALIDAQNILTKRLNIKVPVDE